MRRPRTRWARRRLIRRVVALALTLLVLVLTGLFIAVLYSGLPTYPVESVRFDGTPTAERLSRGRSVAAVTCRRCHSDRIGRSLSGRHLHELAPLFGDGLYAPNLTRDPVHGIGKWTDAQLAWFLRTSIHPQTGRYTPPWMPTLSQASDEDLAAIIAFLRSDDPWVAPQAIDRPDSTVPLPVKLRALWDWVPSPYPRESVASPDPDDPIAYGRYLVDDLLQCWQCHGPDPHETPAGAPHGSDRYLAGDVPLLDANGKSIASSNLTSDLQTGLGSWTFGEFRRAMVDGFRRDDTLVRWPMIRYRHLDDNDIVAIFAYLQTVPAMTHRRAEAADYRILGPRVDPGRHVYLRVGCHYCHGENGDGLVGVCGSESVFAGARELEDYIRDPLVRSPDTDMPRWGEVLSDDDIAAVAGYVRQLCE